MAKEIVIWCTKHLEESEERVPGREIALTVGDKPTTIDLCDACYEEHVAPVVALLATYGQPVTPPKRKSERKAPSTGTPGWPPSSPKYQPNEDGEFVCADCGRTFDRPQALGRHRTVHA